ncbi:MAG: DUF2007 domain-containing protein [Syntrophomonas sp.]
MISNRWSLLGHVDQYYMAEMIRETLLSEGIPVDVKSRETGAYLQIYMGASFTGFDIYVPSDRFEEARQFSIMAGFGEDFEVDAGETKEASEQSDLKRRKRLKMLFVAIIFILFILGPLAGIALKYAR